jgi:nucleoside-diphosphate-sugar epimerase
MRIAIFGATSQIAKDLIVSCATRTAHELTLFSRRPEAVGAWLGLVGLTDRYPALRFEEFRDESQFDAILNFVGVGSPTQAIEMGESIFDVTLKYDVMAINYLRSHPGCRYVFMSSGAAYGSRFEQAVDHNSFAQVSINNLGSQDWYGAAKLYAECRHRAMPHLPIVDVRVFNYFSHSQDLSARFFISDILRAIQSRDLLKTTSDNIVRDYIGPEDFFRLLSLILSEPPVNEVVDCFTLAPVDKITLLELMKKTFGLRYEMSRSALTINATGLKHNYFSNNRRAEIFGYMPSKTAAQTVLVETELALQLRHGLSGSR